MRKYGKWVLTLGLAAATPSVAMADGFLSSIFKPKSPQAATQASGKASNQQTAEQIAAGLRGARLSGYDIKIKYEGGVATLEGKVQNADQRARATKVAEAIPGVQVVVNRMTTLDSPVTAATPQAKQPVVATPQADSKIQLTAAEFVKPATGTTPTPAAGASNQQTAEKIAGAMASAGLSGYDIQIRFKDGTCTLEGVVGSPSHRAVATQVASSVPGVKQVQNRLSLLQPVQQTAYQQPQPGVAPAGYYQGGAPGMPAPAPGAAAQPVGLGGAGQPVYNMPNLPSHSWPTYAAYPNYAQVTYPQQYSASAWPYIGPYYPYPQVPLGWRKATLEWDDGYWNLNFNPRTDRWWWFLQPKNW